MKLAIIVLFMPLITFADCRVVKAIRECRQNGICVVLMDDNFETLAVDPLVGEKMCRAGNYYFRK